MKKLVMMLAIVALIGSAWADLVLYLPFDTATQATDQSGQGNNGTFVGTSAVTTTAGNFKLGTGALSITSQAANNGVIGSTDSGFSYGDAPWSLSAWVKTTDTKHTLVGWGNSVANQNTNLWMQDNYAISISHWSATTDCKLGVAAPGYADWNNGVWHLITGTYDGTIQRLYVDGVEKVTKTKAVAGALAVQKSVDATARWVVGKLINNYVDNAQICVGQIDDVAVFNHALSVDDVAYLWNGGAGNPAGDLGIIRGAAHDPTPDGSVDVDSTTVTALTWLSGDEPEDDPNITSVSGYDVYLYGKHKDTVTSDDPNFLGVTPTYETSESHNVSLAVDYTYFWRVDSTVVWDSNEAGGPLIETVEGPEWQFTTLPANPAPIVDAGSDIVTALDFMPAVFSGTVTDADIASVNWSIVGYPGDAVNAVARSWYRTQNPGAIHDPNLLREGIITDGRQPGNPLRLIISGIPAGTYSWKSYHHDAHDIIGKFDVIIDDSDGRDTYTGYQCSVGPTVEDANVATFEAPIVSDGSDVVVIFDLKESTVTVERLFSMNGFDLVGTAGSLNIDFGPSTNNPIKEGYQAYNVTDNDLAGNVAQTYSAFGGTVTVDPEWGLYQSGLGIITASVTTGGTLSAPQATFTTNYPGTYTLKLEATDTKPQTDSDEMQIYVGTNPCDAAQHAPGWAGFNYYDRDSDCDVDLEDFAVFAAEWMKCQFPNLGNGCPETP